jgi:3-dehydroquinate dehydratase-1
MTIRTPSQGRRFKPAIVGVIASRDDLRRAVRMRKPPDLFELRLDHFFKALDELEKKLSMLRAPLILTARDWREGGANHLSIGKRRELFFRFLHHASYIDVELRAAASFRSLLRAAKKNVLRIISFHDLKSTPDSGRLQAIASQAKIAGADIFKVATRIDTPDQLSRLLDFARTRNVALPIAAMGIGKLGAASRIALAQRGSILNYASVGRATIEGQLSIKQLRAALRR